MVFHGALHLFYQTLPRYGMNSESLFSYEMTLDTDNTDLNRLARQF